MSAHLASWYRRRELDLAAERQIARAVLESGGEAPRHRNAANLPDTSKAAGIPLQIISGGHAIVGMQRAEWRPDRITEAA